MLILRIPTDNTRLEELPEITAIDGFSFNLKAVIGGNGSHFVSYVKKLTGNWVYYDGLGRNKTTQLPKLMWNFKSYKNRQLQLIVKEYPICNIIYELLNESKSQTHVERASSKTFKSMMDFAM